MTPSSQPDDRDPLSAYADGDSDAVRAARPPEPSEAAWEQTRLRIHARLTASREPTSSRRRGALWTTIGTALTTAAAAVAWIVFSAPAPQQPGVVVEVKPQPQAPLGPVPVAPAPHHVRSDPLAEFAVLPMAGAEEVVLHRVPGDGWLPVGAHPLPGTLELATSADVNLDDPDSAWPNVTTSPADAPMIFAAKPR